MDLHGRGWPPAARRGNKVSEHVHDCTGPDMTCPCGYVFRIPPICVSIEIFDKDRPIIATSFNCETLSSAIYALRDAALKLADLENQLAVGRPKG
jgi:hypothetical protein